MLITPYLHGLATRHTEDLLQEAARARRIAAAWAYKRSYRPWTRTTKGGSSSSLSGPSAVIS